MENFTAAEECGGEGGRGARGQGAGLGWKEREGGHEAEFLVVIEACKAIF